MLRIELPGNEKRCTRNGMLQGRTPELTVLRCSAWICEERELGSVRKTRSDVAARLALTETACAVQGAWLTPNRHDVLAIILAAEQLRTAALELIRDTLDRTGTA